MKSSLGIYIHIPFCIKKCAYCDFLSFSTEERTQSLYTQRLKREIDNTLLQPDTYIVDTVFVGGGTPSILKEGEIAQIMDRVFAAFQLDPGAEITIEANPGTVTKAKLAEYQKAGINRISFGLQSGDNSELKLLGRIHTFESFVRSYEMARAAGFTNINVDLMSALPGQTLASYHKTLQQVLALKPEHISAYSLMIEEDTPFEKRYQQDVRLREQGKIPTELPDEETERLMYQLTADELQQYGYERYEISNYARSGFSCRHNSRYWRRQEYLGMGLGAASLFRDERSKNTSDLQQYLNEEPKKEEQFKLTADEKMEEFMFLGLRLMEGISISEFEKQFHKSFKSVYGQAAAAMQESGLLQRAGDQLKLTENGINISNFVLSKFLI